MTSSAAARLDPVGRLRLPRRPALLRAAAAAALLVTAAAVLYAGGDPPPAGAGQAGGAPASPGSATPDRSNLEHQDPVQPAPDPDWPGPDPDLPGSAWPGPERLAIPDGLVGVPVSLSEPARLAVLRPGDRVDLLAISAAGGEPAPLASGAPVLAVDHAAAALLLAVTEEQGWAVASTPPTTTFAVIVRGPAGHG
jgi:hypothetical protein